LKVYLFVHALPLVVVIDVFGGLKGCGIVSWSCDPMSIYAYMWFRRGFCPRCGAYVRLCYRFCPRCGFKLR
jgi:hypothetical protein